MNDETSNGQAPSLPVKDLNQALLYLRRPFPPHAIGWKVQQIARDQQKKPIGGAVVAYIDARLVYDRLNLVVGAEWNVERVVAEQNAKLMYARLTVCGVMREDLGESEKGLSKDLYSDSVKRAAVLFGVGVSVYAIPTPFLMSAGKVQGDARRNPELAGRLWEQGYSRRDQAANLGIPPQTREWLDDAYGKWLESEGISRFGAPLAEEAAWSEDARSAFAIHGEQTDPSISEGGEVETKEPERIDLSARGRPAEATGEISEEAAKLAVSVGEAFALLNDPDDMIERRIRETKGDPALLRVLLKNATIRWHREHADEPCPWEKTTNDDERGETDGGKQAGNSKDGTSGEKQGADGGERPQRRRRQPQAQTSLTE